MPLDLREALTRFARIESEKDLENFKRDYGRSVGYPGFFPQEFWNSWTFTADIPGSRPIPFWRVWRDLLRSAWGAEPQARSAHRQRHPERVPALLRHGLCLR